jgi:signal transduction histidine kinase
VRLKFQSDSITLEVEDHGRGFSPGAAHQGIGLVGMRERAELVQGSLQVVPREGGGTVVRLVVPAEKVEAHGG